MKVVCTYCQKKFHKKGIKNHQRACVKRSYPNEAKSSYTTELTATSADLQYQRELGRKEGIKEVEDRYKTKFNDVQIKAIEAASRVVDAIAHMLGDLRFS
jgi:hypothetical protein